MKIMLTNCQCGDTILYMEKAFFEKVDRVIIGILCILLCCGSLYLYWKRHILSREDICIIPGQRNSKYSIVDLEKQLIERGLININNAGSSEMMKIPGVGPALAQRIIVFRQNHGNFTDKQDLLKVHGIGIKKLKNIEKHIKV